MSDVHIKYLLARISMSGSAMTVRGDEGPRNQHAHLADVHRRNSLACVYCGSRNPLQCDPRAGDATSPICAVRAIEMRKAKR